MTPTPTTPVLADRDVAVYAGVLLGGAVGDAIGLPAEGLSAEKIRRRWNGVWRHRLLFGRGMVSDDTEHATMVAQCLLEHPTDATAFQRALARRLRWWMVALPAGVGFATARAIFKLWLGVPARRSGVRSAGNGPMMRSAVIGVRFARDASRRRAFVLASTHITHTDTRAEIAALAVAEIAAGVACGDDSARFDPLMALRAVDPDPRWQEIVDLIAAAVDDGDSVADFARDLGLAQGVTGYAWHTAPVAVYAWLRHRGDFRAALEAALNCGGDTDTVGAIVGGLAGAEIGESAIPPEWIKGIREWPRSTRWLRRLAFELARSGLDDAPAPPPAYFWPGVLLRNALFLGVVLAHGLFRIVPR